MVAIMQGDALKTLEKLADQSVHCCITSPPYYGLRDYGVDGQIGLEKSPEEYVARLVEIFREVRRVLRDDGTLWLNIADSYAGSGKGAAHYPENAKKYKQGTSHGMLGANTLTAQVPAGCKPKDMIGIPWMLAFALRADGWYLRQEIIWHKGNPMPESVKDRCVKSHESLFLLSKSPRYYFDYRAIQEPANYDGRKATASKGSHKYTVRGVVPGNNIQHMARDGHERWQWNEDGAPVRNKRDVWRVNNFPYKDAHFATFPPKLIEPCVLAGCPAGGMALDPFFGSGTTGEVCQLLGRDCIGIELSAEYCLIAQKRTGGTTNADTRN